ncbi:hypothetical protein HYPSUDRAFT_88091 [Hypholoma sublateritium FD-334 SS-4]|uniref:SHSP domain-containing protein n=1 Tax=Hypholoma sublateritium (strain FD-334 SS-4) TaxID=945553 RepID=A0A0D2L3F6_HYPSF|nr:hypothetical protein HYPSUDRAFT_88091 [Hypholoma sublateritium FD-334 SS-4]
MSNVFFYEPFYDFERLFEEAFAARQAHAAASHPRIQSQSTLGQGALRAFKPRMDLHEDTEKNIVVTVRLPFELPGVAKDAVQLDVRDGRLTVSAEATQGGELTEGGFAVRERRLGRFARTLQLPLGVKDGDIKASMENGLLTVTFPKATAQTVPKKVTIA